MRFTDSDIVDQIALGLGTESEWDSGALEWIADVVGRVRPHPGNTTPRAYLTEWEGTRGPVSGYLLNFVGDDVDEGE